MGIFQEVRAYELDLRSSVSMTPLLSAKVSMITTRKRACCKRDVVTDLSPRGVLKRPDTHTENNVACNLSDIVQRLRKTSHIKFPGHVTSLTLIRDRVLMAAV